MNTSGKNLWMMVVLSCLGLLLGVVTAWAQAPDPDLNDDGVVNILDVSLVGSCIGQDPLTNPRCEVADTDGDGDVDMDDLTFVIAGFGQTGFPTDEEVGDQTPPNAPTVFAVTSPTRLGF